MTFTTFISQLRNQVGDTRRRVHIDFVGDATTTVFQMPQDTFPVLDQAATYAVKLAGATQTETTHYTLDKEAGTLVMVTAPTNGTALTIDSSAVYLTDASYLQITNDVTKSLGDDFFKEFVDATNFLTTANMLSLSLVASQPNCIAVYELGYRSATTEDWTPVENFSNWRYDRDNNIIYIGGRESFSISNQFLRIRGLKTYTLGATVGDTIDIQDKFMTIIELGSIARYWKYRYKNVIQLISKMSTESTRTPLQELMMLADRFTRDFMDEKARLKPGKPARQLPNLLNGSPRP